MFDDALCFYIKNTYAHKSKKKATKNVVIKYCPLIKKEVISGTDLTCNVIL